MRKVLTLSLLLISFASTAIEVNINNNNKKDATFAFSYYDNDKSAWIVEGWYNVKSQEKVIIDLNSNNKVFYMYGEFADGYKIQGGEGAIEFPIVYESFMYERDTSIENPDLSVKFIKAQARDGKAKINIK